MFIVLELNGCALQHAAAFDIDFAVVVHQDVGDGRIFHERFQRPKTEDLVENFLDDAIPLRQRHRDILLEKELLDSPADFPAQPLFADEA